MKTTNNYADITIYTEWNNHKTKHQDVTHIQRLNIFRDFLYEHQPELLFDHEKGETIHTDPDLLKQYFNYDTSKIVKINKRDIKPLKMGAQPISPRKGRFYPKGILKGIANVFSINMHPFRCLDMQGEDVYCDFNHPLAGKEPKVDIKIEDVIEKQRDTGSSCRHIFEEIMTGPGMEGRFNNKPTDFFSNSPFFRDETVSDEEFYSKPRITAHTDALCRKHIETTYSRLINPDSDVLDLMTSVHSHFPPDHYLNATGIGLNSEEMQKNPLLGKIIVQDLNKNGKLPFDSESFDYITCAMSVEYLVNPLQIFKEANRVLRKGGLFIVSFSNRWFPGKEIRIWGELHDYEKMGLVSEYFHNTEGFCNINTKSIKGFPRPYDKTDRYKETLWFSDPLFMVYATKE